MQASLHRASAIFGSLGLLALLAVPAHALHDQSLPPSLSSDIAPGFEGQGRGVWYLPSVGSGHMNAILTDSLGRNLYEVRGRVNEYYDLAGSNARVGSVEGVLMDVDSLLFVGTFRGWFEQSDGLGRFVAQIHPASGPDPHVVSHSVSSNSGLAHTALSPR